MAGSTCSFPQTRIIDGRKYLLIPADEDIEVNGFGVRVKGE